MPDLSALARQFAEVVGKDYVGHQEDIVARYHVAGSQPALIVAPGSAEEISDVIHLAAQAGMVIIPWGGGVMMERGFAPTRYDIALSLSRLRAVVDFDEANLTVTVQAGLTLAELQDRLSRANQFLPLNPPLPAQATIGGTVAANASGPGRFRYGSARDLVLGMRVALANGKIIHVGGKTVKNVAGYDLSKVFIGSYGTLGIITEVTFRLLPSPQVRQLLSAVFDSLEMALNWVMQVMDSELLPTSLTALDQRATQLVFRDSADIGGCALIISLDGSAETVERQTKQISALLHSAGARSVNVIGGASGDSTLAAVRDFIPSNLSSLCATAFTANLPLSATAQFVTEVETTASQLDLTPVCLVAGDTGTVSCLIQGSEVERLAEIYGRTVVVAARLGGHCVLDHALPALRSRVAVWGQPRDDWKLMKVLKQQFDAGGLFCRGRFVGGI